MSSENLHPIFHRLVDRREKEALLGQHGCVLWLFGLSGSGKSTLAVALERRLHNMGRATAVLDGDNLRTGLNRDLGFSAADRVENIRRVAEVARLLVGNGVVVLASFITPYREQRRKLAEIIGPADLLPVYVRASYETCRARDPKGLYAKAEAGAVAQFTGRDSTFEEPDAAEKSIILETEQRPPEESLEELASVFLPRIRLT